LTIQSAILVVSMSHVDTDRTGCVYMEICPYVCAMLDYWWLQMICVCVCGLRSRYTECNQSHLLLLCFSKHWNVCRQKFNYSNSLLVRICSCRLIMSFSKPCLLFVRMGLLIFYSCGCWFELKCSFTFLAAWKSYKGAYKKLMFKICKCTHLCSDNNLMVSCGQ
jgi:hypothetical protein